MDTLATAIQSASPLSPLTTIAQAMAVDREENAFSKLLINMKKLKKLNKKSNCSILMKGNRKKSVTELEDESESIRLKSEKKSKLKLSEILSIPNPDSDSDSADSASTSSPVRSNLEKNRGEKKRKDGRGVHDDVEVERKKNDFCGFLVRKNEEQKISMA